MKKTNILIACAVLLIAAILVAILAASYHQVLVVAQGAESPISGADIYVQRSSGPSKLVGFTNDDGELIFWTSPLPVPRSICAQKDFYPTSCVSAQSLKRQIIEIAIPVANP